MCHCPKPFISVSSLHTIFSPYLSGFFSSPAKFIPAFLSRRAINSLILYNALHSVWTVTETQIITITPVPSLKPLSIWGQTLQLWLIGAMACSIPPDHCCFRWLLAARWSSRIQFHLYELLKPAYFPQFLWYFLLFVARLYAVLLFKVSNSFDSSFAAFKPFYIHRCTQLYFSNQRFSKLVHWSQVYFLFWGLPKIVRVFSCS